MLRFFLIGSSVFVLLILFLREALFDPRSAGFDWNPISGLISLFGVLVSERPAIVIFMDSNFGLSGSPFRGLLLIFLSLISFGIGRWIKDERLAKASFFCLASMFLSLIMAFGIVPSGLTVDFARWFLWAQQAIIFLLFLVAMWSISSKAKGLLGITSTIIIVSILVFGSFQVRNDFSIFKAVNKSQAVTKSEIFSMIEIVEGAVGEEGCSIVSDSQAFPQRLIVIQPSKVWEYAESATSCVFVNGSWMHPGAIDGRKVQGFPSKEVLDFSLKKGEVLFLGDEEKLVKYTSLISGAGLFVGYEILGSVGGVSVWRIYAEG